MLRNQFVAETVKNTEFHKSEFHKVGFSLRFETARTAFKQIFVECTTIKMVIDGKPEKRCTKTEACVSAYILNN